MKDHLSSTEAGVFHDTIDKTIKGLHENIDRWAMDLRPALKEQDTYEEEAVDPEIEQLKLPLEYVFADVEAVFHRTYSEEDIEETPAKVEAKRVLRQLIDTAEEAIPILTREMEKCKA